MLFLIQESVRQKAMLLCGNDYAVDLNLAALRKR